MERVNKPLRLGLFDKIMFSLLLQVRNILPGSNLKCFNNTLFIWLNGKHLAYEANSMPIAQLKADKDLLFFKMSNNMP